jgi:uncharacterized protein YuzE
MKITYDKETDAMVITLRDAPLRESDEVQPGVIADFGGIVRFEILSASTVVDNTQRVDFAQSGSDEDQR